MLIDCYYFSKNLFQMQNSKQRIAFLPVIAMLLYLVPNLIQDIHRVWGHPESQFGNSVQSGIQMHCQADKCPVCVFEFNVIDQLENTVYISFLRTEPIILSTKQEDQFYVNTFHYYNLRGPPIV